jgi:CheY-like chemotaxis protein
MDPLKLLLVDDDDAVRLTLGAVLKYHGFLVISAGDVPGALELVSKEIT